MRRRLSAVVVVVGLVASACQSGRARATPAPTTFAPDNLTSRPRPTARPPASSTTTTVPPGPRAPVVARVRTALAVVFVTIDDGIVRDPRVLQLEQRLRWPVTLFLVRGPARAGLSYWRAMQAAGASIEDHTITHPFLDRLDYADQQHEVCGDLDELTAWFGARPSLLRPPYGAYDTATERAAASCGLRAVVLWTATVDDGRLRVVGRRPLRPGDVVLLHFRPDLYRDLVALELTLGRLHLGVGSLEAAVGAPALVPSPGAAPTTVPGE